MIAVALMAGLLAGCGGHTYDPNEGVDTTGVTQLKRYIAGQRTLDPLQKLAADVTGEGKLNTTDVTQIKRFIAQMRTFDW